MADQEEKIPIIYPDLIDSFVSRFLPASSYAEADEILYIPELARWFASERTFDGTPDPLPFYLEALKTRNVAYRLSHDPQGRPCMFLNNNITAYAKTKCLIDDDEE